MPRRLRGCAAQSCVCPQNMDERCAKGIVCAGSSWSRTQMRVIHILNTSLLKCGLHTRQYFVFRCLLDFERICLTTESVNRCQPTCNEYRALGMGGLPLAKCCFTPALLVFRERSWSRTPMRVLHILNTVCLVGQPDECL